MLKLSLPKQTNASFFFAAALALFLAGAGGFYWLFGEIQEKNRAAFAAKTEIDRAAIRESEARVLGSLVIDDESGQNKLNGLFVKESGAVDFLESLEAMAVSENLSFEIVSLEEREKSAGIKALDLQIKISGSWSGVYRYVAGFSLLPFKTSIERLQIEYTEDEKTGETRWTARLRGSVPLLTEDKN